MEQKRKVQRISSFFGGDVKQFQRIIFPRPAANYVPFRRSGKMIFISGQIPKDEDGSMHTGKLGADLKVEDGQNAARLVALNIISQMRQAANGDLTKVKSVVKLEGFVNATADFTDHPKVGKSEAAIFLGSGWKPGAPCTARILMEPHQDQNGTTQ